MATDGFVMAALTQAHRNIDEYTSSWGDSSRPTDSENTSSHSTLKDDYNSLVIRWNNLVHEFHEIRSSRQEAFRQLKYAMLFINLGLIARGKHPLTYSQIQSCIDVDPILSGRFKILDKIGPKSNIGFISQSKQYWENMNVKFFLPLKTYFETGKDPDGMFEGLSKEEVIQGIYGQVSCHQIFYNNKQSIQILADEKIQLKNKVYELTDEVERLNEENAQLRAQLAALQNT